MRYSSYSLTHFISYNIDLPYHIFFKGYIHFGFSRMVIAGNKRSSRWIQAITCRCGLSPFYPCNFQMLICFFDDHLFLFVVHLFSRFPLLVSILNIIDLKGPQYCCSQLYKTSPFCVILFLRNVSFEVFIAREPPETPDKIKIISVALWGKLINRGPTET